MLKLSAKLTRLMAFLNHCCLTIPVASSFSREKVRTLVVDLDSEHFAVEEMCTK